MLKKVTKLVLVLIVLLLFGVVGYADAVEDAAISIMNGDLEVSEVSKIFTASEMKAVNNKIKELKVEQLKKKKEQEERDKQKKLNEILESKKERAKENIIYDDIDQRLVKVKTQVSALEKRVTKLEKNKPVNKESNVKKTQNTATKKKMTIQEASELVIQGKVGDGEDRVEKLKKLGFSDLEIKKIQKEVNTKLQLKE